MNSSIYSALQSVIKPKPPMFDPNVELTDVLRQSRDLTPLIQQAIGEQEPAPSQLDVDLAKGKARKLQTDTEIKLQEAMGPDTYHGGEFKPELGAYPQTPSVPYPPRPKPQLSPASYILAAIGGMVAPGKGAHFASAALHGAIAAADQHYGDALHARQAMLQQLEQHHEDELQLRNETMKILEANFSHKEREGLQNHIAGREYSEALNKLKAKGVSEDALNGDLEGLSARDKKSAQAAMKLKALVGQQQSVDKRVDILGKMTETMQRLKDAKEKAVADQQEKSLQHAETKRFHDLEIKRFDADRAARTAKDKADRESREAMQENMINQVRIPAMKSLDSYRRQKLQSGGGRAASIKALEVENPHYKSLVRDYVLEERNIQHYATAAKNSMALPGDKADSWVRAQAASEAAQKIKTEMDRMESEYNARKGGGTLAPAKVYPPRSGTTNGKKWSLEPG